MAKNIATGLLGRFMRKPSILDEVSEPTRKTFGLYGYFIQEFSNWFLKNNDCVNTLCYELPQIGFKTTFYDKNIYGGVFVRLQSKMSTRESYEFYFPTEGNKEEDFVKLFGLLDSCYKDGNTPLHRFRIENVPEHIKNKALHTTVKRIISKVNTDYLDETFRFRCIVNLAGEGDTYLLSFSIYSLINDELISEFTSDISHLKELPKDKSRDQIVDEYSERFAHLIAEEVNTSESAIDIKEVIDRHLSLNRSRR